MAEHQSGDNGKGTTTDAPIGPGAPTGAQRPGSGEPMKVAAVAGPPATPSDAAVTHVEKPPAGQTRVVQIVDGTKLAFDFDISKLKIELRDIDLVIGFPDGSNLVLLDFGVRLLAENAAQLIVDGKPIEAQALLSMVRDFVASDVPVQANLSTQETPKTLTEKAKSESADKTPAPPPQPEIVEVKAEPPPKPKVEEKPGTDNKSIGDYTTPPEIASLTKPVVQRDEGSAPGKKDTHTSDVVADPSAIGPGRYDIPVPEIKAVLLGITDHTATTSAAVTTFQGGLALSPAEKDPSYAIQRAVDTIEGTTGNDVIHADSVTYAGLGTTSRLVELTTKMPETDWVITGMRVSGLPDGFTIVGATRVNGSYVIPIDPSHPELADIKLQYVLPDGSVAADAKGFYQYFTLKFDYDIHSSTYSATATTTGSVQFGIRDVASEADAIYVNPVSNTPIYVLWSTPPGTIVHAGAGDDVVHAGAGHDVLDGGSGFDTVAYDLSNAAVRVNLATNTVSGGYATGDTISGFENVEGSKFADVLIGDDGANTLTGGAGADRLEGGAGVDTARYDSSPDGVVIDLAAGTGHGGDAEGDVLVSIENVYGSAFADKLVGDGGDNELHGGADNDVLIGAGGADLLDGGDGIDTADYSAGQTGIAVDLTAGIGSAGDAAGDRLVSIETVIGTAFDDTILGSAADETLKGGDGNDILDGRGGDDVLDAGAGDDRLTGGAGADVLMGGAGSDTATYAGSNAAVTIDLTTGIGHGGDAEGDRLVSIENLVGSDYSDTLIGTSEANVLQGGGGDDVLRGGGGADILDGGDGSDTADYATSSAGVAIDLAAGTATGGDATGDTLISIENVIGSAMADILTGDAGANRLVGGAGDDLLTGRGGADTLDGGIGNDTASYAGSAAPVQIDLSAGTAHGGDAEGDVLVSIENLIGSADNDILSGDSGANVLTGGAGDDILTGGAGADVLDGGAGNDTASYAGSALGVTVDLATGFGQSGDAAGDRLIGIENLIGSAQADTLRGDSGANELHGGAGDDILVGGGGADVLDGGTGFDIASYAGSAAAVTVDLGTGSASGGDAAGDTLVSIEGVIGSDFDDMLRAGAAAATLSGGGGNDTLIGGASADTLSGGSGDDLLIGGGGADSLDGGSGLDTASYAASAAGVTIDLLHGTGLGGDAQGDTLANIENVVGSAFDDTLIGSSAGNVLSGGAGDDTLIGGAGADVLDGGAGFDTADYSGSGFGVTVNLATGINGGGDAQGDTLISIERIVGSAYADSLTGGASDDVLVGGGGDDILAGGAGNDRLEGGDGNDILAGGAGADTLIGGAGTDTASYADSQAGVQVDLAVGTGLGGDAAGDTLSGIENLTGSAFDDVLRGDAGDNRLEGGAGNDRLEGGTGNDVLVGGSGDDVLVGGAGADVLQGGDGNDTVDYSGSASGVGVNLATRTGSGGDANGDTFFDIENVTGTAFDDTLIGNAGANTIIAGAGNDVVDGGAGNDVIDAGAGDDIVTGGAGADELHGGAGFDILSYAQSSAGVTVDLAAGTGRGGDAEGDAIDGFEEVDGSALADTLLGSAGDDILRGGVGDDLLQGRGGADILDGGAGTDTVSYSDSASAVRVDLDAGTATGGDAQGDTLISIERVVGSAHDDWLKAATTGSRLDGGAGDDILVSGAGADTLIGGSGIDLADYSASNAGVTVNLTTGSGSGGFAEGDTLSGVEQIQGSAFADRLTGDAGANLLIGGAGDDVLAGLGGADTIDGGAGFDTLDYSASAGAVVIDFATGTGTGGDAQGDSFANIEAVRGSALDDRFIGDAAAHAIYGLGGDDTVVAGSGAEAIDGGSGLDTVDYSASTAGITVDLAAGTASGGFAQGDTLTSIEGIVGTAFADTLIGSAGVNVLSGGAGDDLVRGGAGADVLDGGSGVDTLDYSTSAAGVVVNLATGFATGGDATGDTIANFENVIGSALADTLTGDAGANVLAGGAGDDILAGLAGADTLDGGTGFDTADYSASSAAVTIDLGAGTASGGDAQGDTLVSIEAVIGSAFADTLTGSSGSDRLDGGAGDDILYGSLGADQLIGGTGNDTADYSASNAGVTVALDGSAGMGGYADGDTLSGIENLTGSAFADRLTGDGGANILSGGDGNDVLSGGAGDDLLLGGSGDDVLIGGTGADRLDGGVGFDTADYSSSSTGIIADLQAGTISGGDATGDTLVSIERIVGTVYADMLTAAASGSTLEGNAGDDTLIGGAGIDTLLGGEGNDLILGSAGADRLDGGAGIDTLSYAVSGAGVTVDLRLSTGQVSGGDADGDVLSNFENVTGSAFADTLIGNAAANTLTGGDGDDVLAGLGGADTLIGGAGTDTADYSASASGVTVNLSNNQNFGGDAAGDMLVGIENVTGSAFADVLTGDAGANVLRGGSGDDVLAGLGGADVLDGGAGSNTADYSASASGVAVSLANFSVDSSLGTIAAGGAGLGGDAQGDTYIDIQNLIGSAFADTLAANAAGGRIAAGAGNDRLIANAGADDLDGGAGTDTADYGHSTAAVSVDLSAGTGSGGYAQGDTLTSIENLAGSSYGDTLTGSGTANVIAGGDGNDTIEGLGGADTLDGGTGTDTVSYTHSGSGVTIDLGLATAQVSGGDATGDVLSNFENVAGSAFADTLTGTAGANVLTGGAGDDVLAGLGGADILDGGAGSDTASYAASAAAVTVNLSTGAASGGDAQGDTLIAIENLIGSAFADTLTGDAGVNRLDGGAGDDLLAGLGGADILDGGAGTDTASYAASGASVTVNLTTNVNTGGDAQGDILSNIENVTGSAFADTLTGNAGINTLTGGAGDDVLAGLGGADILDGGAGSDTASYAASGAAVTVNLATGAASGGDAQGDTLISIENVIGSAFADTLTAAAAGSRLSGGDGNDTLVAGAGADTLDGGAGTDTADYSASTAAISINLLTGTASGGYADGDTLTGIENVVGSGYDDLIVGDAGANTLTGGAGNDTLIGGAGADVLDGGAGTDTADYSSSGAAVSVNLTTGFASDGNADGDTLISIENLVGSNFNDTLTGDAGVNVLKGGAGDDVLVGLGGADVLDGGTGSNTADYSASAAAVNVNLASNFGITTPLGSIAANGAGLGGDAQGDTYTNIQNLIGSAFGDTLAAGTAGGRLAGGAGNDTLVANSGADVLDGGTGTDFAHYGYSTAAVTVNLSTGTASGGYAAGDTLIAIESLYGSNYGDLLTGSSVANTIYGQGGDDTIEGLGGADTLDGGTGTDTVSYANSGSGVTVDLGLATAQVSGGDAAGDVLSNFENVAGSAFADTLIGNAGANTLSGGAGDDVLAGLGGADILDGGAGSDTASYAASAAAVTVNLATGAASGGDAQGDTLISIENLIGSAFADTLTGDAGVNRLDGGAGDDLLAGLGGADILDGGAGTDTASYAASGASVTVNLTTNVNTGGDAQGDILSNIENVTGSAFADTLTGNAGINTLTGGAGDDVLAGLGGADILDGGAGSDTASYAASGAAVTVNLATGAASGGDAQGDTLISIENVIGSAFADTLTAAAAGSRLSGGDGNDTLVAGAGADTLDGGAGTDTADYSASTAAISINLLTGTASGGYADGDTLTGIENVVGSAYADVIVGDAGANTLTGGAGNDTLIGGAGADVLDGGAGTDTADYSSSGAAVAVNLSTGSASGGNADGDTLISIENLVGSNFNDTLTGDAGANVLKGGAGDDVLAGLGGADVLDGGAGSNTADYSASAARVVVNLSTAAQTLSGVAVNASAGVQGDAQGDTYVNIQNVIGSAFDDLLMAGSAGGKLQGGAGNDSLFAGAGADVFDGGVGSDTVIYTGSTAAVSINLSTNAASGGWAAGDSFTSIENLTGSNFADVLTGNSLANIIQGGNGNDVIEGLGGADTLDGGAGTDTVSYATSAAGVTVSLALATAQVSAGDASGDILSNFENLTGSAYDDTLTGDANANVLTGGAGDDVLQGGAGADTLDGGSGSDTASYAASAAGVTVDLRLTGAQSSTGDANGDILISIENVTGSALADTLTGNASDNRLSGGAGDDLLAGLGGADVLDGGDGVDTADYSASADAVTINLTLGTGAGGDAQGDTLRNIENVTGSAFDDILTGDANANTLLGGDGDDTLAGLGGADILDGGAGSNTVDYSASAAGVTVNLSATNGAYAAAGAGVGGDADGDTLSNIQNLVGSAYGDYIYASTSGGVISTGAGDDTVVASAGRDFIDGGAGRDTVDYSWSNAAVTVNLTTKAASGGYAAGDVLTNVENITGTKYNDVLTGDAGNNTLIGGDGNDTIDGGAGDDTIDGGTGDDTLSYASATSAVRLMPNRANDFTVSAGTDTSSGMDIIAGSNYSDIINIAYGGWQVNGGAGNDLIVANGNAGLIDGGTGIDTLSLISNNWWGGATVDLATNTTSSFRAWGGGAQGDWYTGIENIIGSAYRDYLAGDGGVNAINGGAGSDWLRGAGGNDILYGGAGDDLLIGGTGADALIGGLGTDTASWAGSSAGVTANLATGIAYGGDAGTQGAATAYTNASLVAGWGFKEGTGTTAATINGANVSLTLNGTTGWTTGPDNHGAALDFKGRGANDYATIGNMTLGDAFTVSTWVNFDTKASGVQEGVWKIGTANNQWLFLTKQANGNIYAEIRGDLAGATSLGQSIAGVYASSSYVTIDQWMNIAVTYQAGRLQLYINGDLISSNDTAIILPTSATFTSNFIGRDHSSVNYLDGQVDDFAVFNTALTEAEIQQLATQKAGLESAGLVTDTLSGIENLTGTDYADTLTGDAGDNVLDGGAGNDTLRGGDGSDTLIGGAGADVLDGGNGTDIVSYALSAAAVTVNLDTQTASGGDAQGDTLTSIEGVIGSARNDTLTAGGTGSTLIGGAGNDTLIGGAGNDTIKGDDDLGKLVTYAGTAVAGTNLLANGNFESYSVNHYNNSTITTGSSGWQTSTGWVYISDSVYIADGSAENQSLRLQAGQANNDVWQTVTTTAGETYLLQFDLGGLTTLQAALGIYVNGTLIDTLSGGAVSQRWQTYDYLVTGTGSDKIEFKYLSSSDQVLIDNVIFTAVGGRDVIDGGAGNDDIDGGFGNDTIRGGEGDDHIVGGLGNDTIDGGDGNDTISGDADVFSAPGLETFSSGTGGWTGLNGTAAVTTTLSDGSVVLGSFTGSGNVNTWVQQVSKSYQLTDPGATNTTVSFDLYLLDSFDVNEGVKVYVNGTAVLTITAPSGFNGVSSLAGLTFVTAGGATYTASLAQGVYSGLWAGLDDKLSITLTVPTPGSVLTLGFGSNMNEPTSNESFAVDNVNVPGSGIIGDSSAAGDDVITGGAGDDIIDGGAGNDRAIYSGNRGAYTVSYNAVTSTYSISGPDGNDTVKNVERFTFDDGTLTASRLVAGMVFTSAGTIAENSAGGTVAATLAMTDGSTVSYAISGGTDAAAFTVAGNQILLANGAALDYEAGATRTLQVTATAADGSTHIQTVTVNVADVNEAPTITSAAAFSVAENGTAVGTMTATDPDAGATRSWSIAGTDANLFHIDAQTGALTFVAAPNYEAPQDAGGDNVYNLTVSVSDGTNTTSQGLAVTVTNVNEAPTLSLTGSGSVNENVAAATVATFTASDPDAGTTLSYTLGGADANLFVIDGNTVRLKDGVSLDYEQATHRDLTLTVSDGSKSATQALTVQVTDVNEAPTITSAAAFTVAENGTAVGTMTATDPDAGATRSWSIAGTDANLFHIDTQTGALTFVAAPNYEAPQDAGGDNVYNLTVSVSDGTNTTSQGLAVTVTNVNEAPTLSLTGSGSVNENVAAATVATFTASDPDAGTTLSYTLGGADANLFVIDGNTVRLKDGVSLDYEQATHRDLTLTVSDGANTVTQALTVNVTNVNEAPTITSAAAFTVAENGTAVATMTSTDPDAGATRSWSIAGTDANLFHIDAQTGVLTFVAAPNYEAPQDAGGDNVYNLTVAVSDGTNTTSQGVAVTVTNVNEAPTLSLTGTGPVAENVAAATVATFTASDPDAGTTLSYMLGGADANLFVIDGNTVRLKDGVSLDYEQATHRDLTLTVSDGSKSATQALTVQVTDVNEAPTITSAAAFTVAENTAAVGTMTATDPDAGATRSWSIAGTDANLFHIDAQTGALTFVAAPNYEAPQDAGGDNVYNLTVSVSDGTNTTSQGLAVTVTNVNDAPVITSAAAQQVTEHNTAVATLAATDEDGNSLTWAISGGADAAKFAINPSTGALRFVNAPSYDSPTDAGSDNVYDVQVRVNDGTVNTFQNIAVTVGRDQQAPVILNVPPMMGVSENTTMVMVAAASDPNSGDTVTWSIAGGADAAKFTIDAQTGVLQFVTAPDRELPTDTNGDNVYNVVLQAQDQTGLSSTRALAVTVTDVDEAPVFSTANALSAQEQQTAVAIIVAADPEHAAVSYSIAGGADAALFAINAQTGQLSFTSAQDYQNPGDADHDRVYDVVIRASDGSLTTDRAFAVTLTDVNQPPSFTSATTASVAENSTAVMTVTATDPDAGTTLTYAISGGADAAKFTIDSQTGQLAFRSSPDYEAAADSNHDNVYDVTVLVSDGTNARTQAVAVTVTNVAEAPVFTSAASATVNEGQTAVMTVTATDQDSPSLTYSISGGADAAKFTIDAHTGALVFTAAPDYEAKADSDHDNVYDVQVAVSDGGLTTHQSVAVTVANVAPTITSSATFAMNENALQAGTVTAHDPAGGTLVYALAGGADANLFSIDSATGLLSFRSAPNFESPADAGHDNHYNLSVLVSDGTSVATQAVEITVGDVNEAPTATPAAQAVTIAENLAGATVTSFTGSDPDAGDHLHFALGGADASLFEISGSTVKLLDGVAFDYETKSSYTLNLVVTDDHGLGDTRSIAITVGDVQGENLVGTSGNDRLVGGIGNDTLEGGAGADQLIGGADVDTAVYSHSSAGVTIDLSAGTGHGGEAEGDTLSGIENLVGSDHDDTLTGDAGANRLEGGAGNDTLTGGAGNDVLIGGAGADFLSGGDGDDVFYSEGAGAGQDTMQGGAGFDTVHFTDGGNVILTGIGGVEDLDFRNGAANTATIDGATLTSLAPTSDILVINRDSNDTITLTGATNTGAHAEDHGISYDIYTMHDDQNHQISVHLQSA
jgi:Ca2+-binding RTX toxin-like protein